MLIDALSGLEKDIFGEWKGGRVDWWLRNDDGSDDFFSARRLARIIILCNSDSIILPSSIHRFNVALSSVQATLREAH